MDIPQEQRDSSHDPVACIQRCENCAQTLSEIAERLSGDSNAGNAIAFAKNALRFIAARRCAEFETFLAEMNRGLSAEKKAELKRLGIDLEADE